MQFIYNLFLKIRIYSFLLDVTVGNAFSTTLWIKNIRLIDRCILSLGHNKLDIKRFDKQNKVKVIKDREIQLCEN